MVRERGACQRGPSAILARAPSAPPPDPLQRTCAAGGRGRTFEHVAFLLLPALKLKLWEWQSRRSASSRSGAARGRGGSGFRSARARGSSRLDYESFPRQAEGRWRAASFGSWPLSVAKDACGSRMARPAGAIGHAGAPVLSARARCFIDLLPWVIHYPPCFEEHGKHRLVRAGVGPHAAPIRSSRSLWARYGCLRSCTRHEHPAVGQLADEVRQKYGRSRQSRTRPRGSGIDVAHPVDQRVRVDRQRTATRRRHIQAGHHGIEVPGSGTSRSACSQVPTRPWSNRKAWAAPACSSQPPSSTSCNAVFAALSRRSPMRSAPAATPVLVSGRCVQRDACRASGGSHRPA